MDRKDKRKKRPTIEKAQISEPFEFEHVAHMGANQINVDPAGDPDDPVDEVHDIPSPGGKVPPAPCPGNTMDSMFTDPEFQKSFTEDIAKSVTVEVQNHLEMKLSVLLSSVNEAIRQLTRKQSIPIHCTECKRSLSEISNGHTDSCLQRSISLPVESYGEKSKRYKHEDDPYDNIDPHELADDDTNRKFVDLIGNPDVINKTRSDRMTGLQTGDSPRMCNPMYGASVSEHITSAYNPSPTESPDQKRRPVPRPRTGTAPKLEKSDVRPRRTRSLGAYPSPIQRCGPNTWADERECLAHAFQSNIEALVSNLIFKDSELPDELQANNYLTDEECKQIRNTPDTKNQVRMLSSVIRGRDFHVLEGLLQLLDKYASGVAVQVKATFEKNKKDGMRSTLCAACKLMHNVNIKYVVDRLWGHHFITNGLYNEVVYSDKPVGAQEMLWINLMYTLNQTKSQKPFDVLMEVLSERKHYKYIADLIKRQLKPDNLELQCTCEVMGPYLEIQRRSAVMSASTASARSSYERYSKSDEEILKSSEDELDDVDETRPKLRGHPCRTAGVPSVIVEGTEDLEEVATVTNPLFDRLPPLPQKRTITTTTESSHA